MLREALVEMAAAGGYEAWVSRGEVDVLRGATAGARTPDTPLNGSWIVATVIAHGLAVATRADDYDDVPGLGIIKL